VIVLDSSVMNVSISQIVADLDGAFRFQHTRWKRGEMDAFAGKIVGWRQADMSRRSSIRPSSLAIRRPRHAFELLS
jgi:hypothetical protein